MWRDYLRELVRPDVSVGEDGAGAPIDFLAELD
jgi:hypothetical protein